MPMTSIIINSTDGYGKSAQKAITCVNPEATNAELKTFGQMVTATQQGHTYGNTYRIDKTDCDNDEKTTAAFTRVGNASISQTDIVEAGESGIKVATFVGSGPILFSVANISHSIRVDGSDIYLYTDDPKVFIAGEMHNDFLYLPETSTQTSATLEITIVE